MADVKYAVKRCGKWMQGVEANDQYTPYGAAPTMGGRHSYSEYKTIWGNEAVYFERLTLASYIKILCEEYRWGELKPVDFRVVVNGGTGNGE